VRSRRLRRLVRGLLAGLTATGLVATGALAVTTHAAAPRLVSSVRTAEVPASTARVARGHIKVLSSRSDLVSGGEALVRIVLPSRRHGAVRSIRLGRRDVTDRFAARAGNRLIGLVTGLRNGRNTLTVHLRGGGGARLRMINYPAQGPMLSGRQVLPWACNAGARNRDCRRTASYDFYYVPVGVDPETASGTIGGPGGSDAYFQPYDVHAPPPPEAIASTTTDEGRTVPFVVRLETGSVNRGQYQIAVLFDPDRPWRVGRPQPAWNRKLFTVGGPNCGISYGEGSAPGVLYGKVLGRGFATLSHSLEVTGNNCNLVTQAESLMMTKERFIERYGPVRYTMSIGGSGASLVQQWIANAYPGIYDGLIVEASFPDAWTPLINSHDCIGLLDYWSDATRWAPGVAWGPAEQSAVANGDAPSSCATFATVFQGLFTPADETGQIPERKAYDAQSRPRGVRSTMWDYSVSQLGRRPRSAWGPTEKRIGRGFANRPLDTVGIQYGFEALMGGEITAAQFVDLNAKVGGRDIDYSARPRRTVADRRALATVYRSGYLNQGNNLDVPIIDIRGSSNNELHDSYNSWSMRARLDRANGHHRNQVIWNSFTASGFVVDPALEREAFNVMDAWLGAIDKDHSHRALAAKVAANKPKAAIDRCTVPATGLPGPCVIPASGNPRLGAGQPLANDMAKCRLQPLKRLEYFPVRFTNPEWRQLRKAFPRGVCDYARPGRFQQPTTRWLTYRSGPNGDPLGRQPMSHPLHRSSS
jgi:hypothetical protein